MWNILKRFNNTSLCIIVEFGGEKSIHGKRILHFLRWERVEFFTFDIGVRCLRNLDFNPREQKCIVFFTYTLIKCKLSWPSSNLGWIRSGSFHSKSYSCLTFRRFGMSLSAITSFEFNLRSGQYSERSSGKMLFGVENSFYLSCTCCRNGSFVVGQYCL